jgi:hypothetical protein
VTHPRKLTDPFPDPEFVPSRVETCSRANVAVAVAAVDADEDADEADDEPVVDPVLELFSACRRRLSGVEAV